MELRICDKCKDAFIFEDGECECLCDCTDATYWECDEDIYPLLRTLWAKGYETEFSCSGHALTKHYSFNDVLDGVIDRPDYDVYIIVKGPVKVKDFDKYKYGNAYIRMTDVVKTYTEAMKIYDIELPENYKLDINDKYFKEYLSYFSEEDGKSFIDQLSKPDTITYRIGVDYIERPSGSYAERYRKLLEFRDDVAKLIDMLPENN